MWLFWLLSLIPILVCAGFVILNRQVSYKEWFISTGVSLLMTGLFQLFATLGMTSDIEMWSGSVTGAHQYSRWQEYYERAVYRTEVYWTTETTHSTDSEGHTTSSSHLVMKTREVFDHWEPDSTWHNAHWEVFTTLGNWNISEGKFQEICNKFGDTHSVSGSRTTYSHNSRMIGGDPNDYETFNKNNWIEPVNTTRHFENRVKAAPSQFSFAKVPTNISVYPWPGSSDSFVSSRVMGSATELISTLKWDQMNSLLGPTKKVNLIIVGFGDKKPSMATWQEAAWIGGKKNDLVICFGGGSKEKSASWVKVFGWTERNDVKQNIQILLLEYPVNDDLIPMIVKEVNNNYIIKDWSKFDYVKIEPPTWSYWLYFIVMVVVQGGLFFWYHQNDLNQDNDGSSRLLMKLEKIKRLTKYGIEVIVYWCRLIKFYVKKIT